MTASLGRTLLVATTVGLLGLGCGGGASEEVDRREVEEQLQRSGLNEAQAACAAGELTERLGDEDLRRFLDSDIAPPDINPLVIEAATECALADISPDQGDGASP